MTLIAAVPLCGAGPLRASLVLFSCSTSEGAESLPLLLTPRWRHDPQAGGAVLVFEGTVRIDSSVLTGNGASQGGAVYISGASSALSGSNVTCVGNAASSLGGAVAAKNVSAVSFEGSVFAQNVASRGGGFYADSVESFVLRDTQASHNRCGDPAVHWLPEALLLCGGRLEACGWEREQPQEHRSEIPQSAHLIPRRAGASSTAEFSCLGTCRRLRSTASRSAATLLEPEACVSFTRPLIFRRASCPARQRASAAPSTTTGPSGAF